MPINASGGTEAVETSGPGRKVVEIIKRGRQGPSGTDLSGWLTGQSLNVRDYGALGSDTKEAVVDEYAALQAAIDDALLLRRDLVAPARFYLTNEKLVADGPLRFSGLHGTATILGTPELADGDACILEIDPGFSVTTTIDQEITPGQRKIRVASVTGIEPNMVISLDSSQIWPYDGRGQWPRGEIHEVDAVDGSTREITIRDVTRDTYGYPTNTVNVRAFWPATPVLKDLHFEYQEVAGSTTCLRVTKTIRARLENVSAAHSGSNGIAISRSMYPYLLNPMAHNVGNGPNPIGDNIGYGVQITSSLAPRVIGLNTYACRRGIDLGGLTNGGPTRDALVQYFFICGGGMPGWGDEAFIPDGLTPNFGVGMHGPCEGARFFDGKIVNVDSGITVRGLDTHIARVDFIGTSNECIYATYGEGLTVEGCKVYAMQGARPLDVDGDYPTTNSFVTFNHGGSGDPMRWKLGKDTVIRNNSGIFARDFIRFDNQESIEQFACYGNHVTANPVTGLPDFYFYNGTDAGGAEIRNGIIGPNTVIRQRVDGEVYFYNPDKVTLGITAGVDNIVQLGDGRFTFRVDDDARKIIWRAMLGANLSLGARVSIVSNDGAICGDFLLQESGTSVSLGLVGGQVDTVASNLTGTTGVDGRFTVGITDSAIYFENRRGAVRDITVSVQ